MQIKDVSDDEQSFTMPKNESESQLVQMLFEKATELRPDWPMGDRTDLAMAMLSVVKRWAHGAGSVTSPAIGRRLQEMVTDDIDDSIS